MSDRTMCGAQVFRPTLWHRLGFGLGYVAPWDESDDARYISTDVMVQFDWRDRLRLLVTGRLHVFVRTKTEHYVGRVESRSHASVTGPGW